MKSRHLEMESRRLEMTLQPLEMKEKGIRQEIGCHRSPPCKRDIESFNSNVFTIVFFPSGLSRFPQRAAKTKLATKRHKKAQKDTPRLLRSHPSQEGKERWQAQVESPKALKTCPKGSLSSLPSSLSK
jgi:hypothetical protein